MGVEVRGDSGNNEVVKKPKENLTDPWVGKISFNSGTLKKRKLSE